MVLLHAPDYAEQNGIRAGIQLSRYHDTEEEYLILAASNTDPFNPSEMRSVCVGIELSSRQTERD